MFLSRKRSILFILALFLAVFALGACNMPRGNSTPTQSGVSILQTAAAQTVQAQLTPRVDETGLPGTGTPTTPGVTQTPPAPGDTAVAPTAAPGTAAPTANTACDLAEFVDDVTIPDNTEVAPGTTFVKTWRLRNKGTCAWTSAYSLVLTDGDVMGAPATAPVTTGTVAPGETVDISVSLSAPETGGTYRGLWMLRNASNEVFGVEDGTKPIWVQIRVPGASSQGFDFIAQASSAEWFTGLGTNVDFALTFNGEESNPNGVAKILDNANLETGGRSGKILLTVPRHDSNGTIAGFYKPYTVQAGDRFTARLGFVALTGNCRGGQVKFRISVKIGDQIRSLQDWDKACDGRLLPVELDLSSLRGQTVQFILVVFADGSADNDWAIWNSAQIQP